MLVYEILSDNIDGYKWIPLIGHLFPDTGFIIEILRISLM